MRIRILPALGSARLADVRRPDVQALVDRLLAEGLSPSTIRCAVLPLRAIFRRAVSRGELAANPCYGIECRPFAVDASGSPIRPRPRR